MGNYRRAYRWRHKGKGLQRYLSHEGNAEPIEEWSKSTRKQCTLNWWNKDLLVDGWLIYWLSIANIITMLLSDDHHDCVNYAWNVAQQCQEAIDDQVLWASSYDNLNDTIVHLSFCSYLLSINTATGGRKMARITSRKSSQVIAISVLLSIKENRGDLLEFIAENFPSCAFLTALHLSLAHHQHHRYYC